MGLAIIAAQTVLIGWIVLVRAPRRRGELGALAADPDPEAQLRFYRGFLRRWWSTAALAACLLWLGGGSVGIGVPWDADVVVLVVTAAVGLAGSVGLAGVFPPARRFFAWQFSRLGLARVVYPRTRRAAAWFVPVAVTAGVCEELVFRGLVPAWAAHIAAGTPAAPLAPLAASAVGFGLGHLYQGWRGVVLTGLLGGWLYLLTAQAGSVVPAMAVHALIDLRVVALFFVMGPIA